MVDLLHTSSGSRCKQARAFNKAAGVDTHCLANYGEDDASTVVVVVGSGRMSLPLTSASTPWVINLSKKRRA